MTARLADGGWRAAWLGLLLVGCGGRQLPAPQVPPIQGVPEQVDELTYSDALRSFHRLPDSDKRRAEVRRRLLAYLGERSAEVVEAEDFEAAVELLKTTTGLFRPRELAEHMPEHAGSLAKLIRTKGEPRGDEARVLSALWILGRLDPDNKALALEYERLRRWSDEARRDLPGATEHLDGLITVLEGHANLTPSPEVLATLVDLYMERRRKLVELLGPDGRRPPEPGRISFQEYRSATLNLGRAPLDIAGVYLAHDDPERALSRLRTMESVTGLEPRIRTALEVMVSGEPEATDAMLALARAFRESDADEVAREVCRRGARVSPGDARFPQCLGRIAAALDDYAGATKDYAAAIQLAPADRALYDEALEVLANMIRAGLFDTDATQTRVLAKEAEEILQERVRRWPDSPPPLAPEDLQLAVGMAELSAGNAERASEHLKASLAARENAAALVQLGLLKARMGDVEAGEGLLRRALDMSSQRNANESKQRAQFLEYLGDVLRSSPRASQSARLYTEALSLWDKLVDSFADGAARAFAHTRRGVLLQRLGRDKEAHEAFEKAMVASPGRRETYAQILAHLVVSEPRPEMAAGILRRAQRQLTLDPEWKTYFALWVQTIRARAKMAKDGEVHALLTRLARSEAWWGRLAQFGTGTIDHDQLTRYAVGRGEKTEAHFYEAARRLAAGDMDGARKLFEAVIETRMVSFYEYQMAQELLLLDRAGKLSLKASP